MGQSKSTEVQLELYGLYKRVTHGVAPRSQRPPMWDLAGQAKYDAWVRQTDKARQQAAEEYEALVNKLRKADSGGGGGASTGPRVSKMMHDAAEPLPDTPYERFKALIGHASEAKLRLEASIDLVAERDEEHRTLLHWAADGNQLEAIQVLVDAGADVNAQDDEELTPLTYAVCNDYVDAAKLLVRLGADTSTTREFARGEMCVVRARAVANALRRQAAGARVNTNGCIHVTCGSARWRRRPCRPRACGPSSRRCSCGSPRPQ